MALTALQKSAIMAEFSKHLGAVTPRIPSDRLLSAIGQFSAFLDTQ